MIVAECLKDWLSNYQCSVDFSEILTDFINAPDDCLSLFKSPNRNIVEYTDGSKLITEYYQFFARKNTLDDSDRIDNEQFLADLEEWIEQKDADEEYPDLSEVGNLICTEVGITNSSTITSQEIDNAIYQITISIQYLKEEGK